MNSAYLQELISEPFGVLSSDIDKLQRLVVFYRLIYNESCVTCGGTEKYSQYYERLKNEGLKILINMENSEFIFKKTVTSIPKEFGSSIFITQANLTDEVAIELLSRKPNLIVLFEKYPSDWKDRINKPKVIEPEEVDTEVQVPKQDKKTKVFKK